MSQLITNRDGNIQVSGLQQLKRDVNLSCISLSTKTLDPLRVTLRHFRFRNKNLKLFLNLLSRQIKSELET